MNECIGRPAKNEKIEKINANGITTDVPLEIANEFNNFFVKVDQQISDSVPTIDKNHDIQLLNLQNVTPEFIVKIVKELASKNSSDIDGMSSKMAKFVAKEISIPLSHIFNLSLESGIFPEKLKRSRVIPIFKSGSKNECDNYRPISLLCSILKILEKLYLKNFLPIFNQTIFYMSISMVSSLKGQLNTI